MKFLIILVAVLACNFSQKTGDAKSSAVLDGKSSASVPDTIAPPVFDAQSRLVRLNKSDAAWQNELGELEYYVLRKKGTERAFTGDLLNEKKKGVFVCRGCHLPLFGSDAKFESGTGWPSFWKPIGPGLVAEHRDASYGMVRNEVACARCEGHLGHVFDDGPQPTGLRYCINSVSLDFAPN